MPSETELKENIFLFVPNLIGKCKIFENQLIAIWFSNAVHLMRIVWYYAVTHRNTFIFPSYRVWLRFSTIIQTTNIDNK